MNGRAENAMDDLLVLKAQQGDKTAFEALYRRYHARLVRFAFSLCRDRDMAQDSVQEAWIGLSNTLRRLKDPRAFRSWAYRLVRWRTLDALRKTGAEAASLDEVSDSELVQNENESLSASWQFADHLAHLKPFDRQILTLFYLEEMKLLEIAHVLDVPFGTVKSRLSRARESLRRHIQLNENSGEGPCYDSQ